VDFCDVSYGFRPYRSCHDALDMVDMIIMTKPVNSVVDMDITKFFDMVDHECMMECLKQRVVDPSLLRITFDFLGFTLYCDKTRNGKFKVGRKTSSKKFRQKMKSMNLWLKGVRNRMILELWWPLLVQKMTGHYQYYGISGNIRGLQSFYHHTVELAFKWINRLSQRKSYNWSQFNRFLSVNRLPKPNIYHFYALTKQA
jgi:hypothetical protein